MAENINMPIISKRLWSMVRVLYYMLRKGISKTKLQVDIDLLMKRSKSAGQALVHSLVFPHLMTSSSSSSHHLSHVHQHKRGRMSPPSTDYEFSCSNTPAHTFPIFHTKRNNKHSHFFGCAHAPRTNEEEEEGNIATANNNAIKMLLEMLNNHSDVINNNNDEKVSVQASPALPGFGRSPAVRVRQLRVTDSPFPLHDVSGDRQVDEKADKFIAKFYSDLKRQRILATPSPGRPWW